MSDPQYFEVYNYFGDSVTIEMFHELAGDLVDALDAYNQMKVDQGDVPDIRWEELAGDLPKMEDWKIEGVDKPAWEYRIYRRAGGYVIIEMSYDLASDFRDVLEEYHEHQAKEQASPEPGNWKDHDPRWYRLARLLRGVIERLDWQEGVKARREEFQEKWKAEDFKQDFKIVTSPDDVSWGELVRERNRLEMTLAKVEAENKAIRQLRDQYQKKARTLEVENQGLRIEVERLQSAVADEIDARVLVGKEWKRVDQEIGSLRLQVDNLHGRLDLHVARHSEEAQHPIYMMDREGEDE